MAIGLAWQIALSVAVCAIGVFVRKMLKVRLPMPPWNFAAGHLECLPALLEKFPKDSQPPDAFTLLSYDFKDTDGCFYMDVWPFTGPILVITSPELAIQACQEHDLVKPESLVSFFAPLAVVPYTWPRANMNND